MLQKGILGKEPSLCSRWNECLQQWFDRELEKKCQENKTRTRLRNLERLKMTYLKQAFEKAICTRKPIDCHPSNVEWLDSYKHDPTSLQGRGPTLKHPLPLLLWLDWWEQPGKRKLRVMFSREESRETYSQVVIFSNRHQRLGHCVQKSSPYAHVRELQPKVKGDAIYNDEFDLGVLLKKRRKKVNDRNLFHIIVYSEIMNVGKDGFNSRKRGGTSRRGGS